MRIGGKRLVQMELDPGEELILQSHADVEETSCYTSALNPLNLYKLGAVFYLGRLFLTTERVILLPYAGYEVKRAKRFEKIAYELIDKCGLGIPSPEIQFFPWLISVALGDIRGVNPFRKQAGVHPSLCLYTEPAKYVFKFTHQDDPEQWANLISELGGAAITDMVVNECAKCGMIGMAEGADACAACGATQGPSAQDIWSGKWATDLLGQLASIKGWKQKLRALTMPSGHTAECPQCHYMNHRQAAFCKYCHAAV
jgi:hypothetical protein